MTTDISASMRDVAEAVVAAMADLTPPAPEPRGRVVEAMRYACFAGGKRLRPFLLVSSADMFGCPRSRSMRAAAALEMIHSYSLVHDDLPAMDDADLRRGKPSAHKAFDEATAILAGDGLLTLAFEVMADPATHPDAQTRCAMISALAVAAGPAGMVGGQMIDLSDARLNLDLAGITELQNLKTGALIRYACVAGGMIGGADEEEVAALGGYAEDLGLAFQIVDDLLDAFGTEEELGKPAGQDAEMDKATFVKLLGAEGARDEADKLVTRAEARLDRFGEAAHPLRSVARFVLERTS
ncbi:MAG: polyprenyl synthetase family protein [Pseudomonadota bacterium]